MKDKHGTLQVTGTGEIKVAPDEAFIRLSVLTEGKTATQAVEANAKRTQAVLDAVSALPNHGVTTSGLSVNPIVRYEPDTRVPTIIGFRATNAVEVLTKIDYASQVYDAGVEAGANQSSGITFRIQNETPHRERALRAAVKEATMEAKIVADTAKVSLEGPESIHIDSGSRRMFLRAETLDAAAPSTPVIPGDLTISASVQIEFRTKG